MPRGSNHPGDFRNGTPLSEPPTFGTQVTTPRDFGSNINHLPDPISFGNAVTLPKNFGNVIDLSTGPFIEAILPISGPQGTAVTISGNGFLAGATVFFGSAQALSVVVVSATTITCEAPIDLGGTPPVFVLVTNADGQQGLIGNAYTYVVEPVSQNFLLQEDGVGFFTLETGAGFIILET